MRRACQFILASASGLLLAADALGAVWVNLTKETDSRLVSTLHLVDHDNLEKDMAFGDFDQDGDLDLIIVRKFPGSIQGGFPDILLMNEGGVLVDRTEEYGTASDVAGSVGLKDLSNDRDVEAVDVDNDGWLDLVTATTMSDQLEAQPWLGQPRVYHNKGNDENGNWLGFRNEDLRIPTLKAKNGSTANPRFCEIAVWDFTGDGYLDIYYTDYDTPETSGTVSVDLNQDGDSNDPGEKQQSPGETSSKDYDDKLLVNLGAANPGFFIDSTTTVMSATMLSSGFGNDADVADMNGDGIADLVKTNTLGGSSPHGQSVSCIHNDPNNPGAFIAFNKYMKLQGDAPYNTDLGDINNDGKIDILVADDGVEYWRRNNGPGANGVSDTPDFTKVNCQNSNSGFTNTTRLADLNNDGWIDGFICDVDGDLESPFCPQSGPERLQIFRNTGASGTVNLRDETAEPIIPHSQLWGTYDVAPFDLNGDGWKDLVIARCAGIDVYMNQPQFGLTFAYPGGIPSILPAGQTNTVQVQIDSFGGANLVGGSPVIHWSLNGGEFTTSPLTSIGGSLFEATLPAGECHDIISYYFTAGTDGTYAGTFASPYGAPGVTLHTVALADSQSVATQDFEGDVSAWTVTNDGVASGGFQVLDPKATAINAKPMSPENDASAAGTKAFMTSAGGTGADANDLDGGPSTLLSPVLDLAGKDAWISYSRYFRDQFNGTVGGNDQFVIEISNDGAAWVQVESVTFAPPAWVKKSFRVSDFVAPTATVQMRFVASDNPNNSITIAGVDEFAVSTFECGAAPCLGDFDGNGEVDGGDLGLLLGAWDTDNATYDVDQSGIVDGADLGLVLGAWGACP